jgi:hypothetical protein
MQGKATCETSRIFDPEDATHFIIGKVVDFVCGAECAFMERSPAWKFTECATAAGSSPELVAFM